MREITTEITPAFIGQQQGKGREHRQFDALEEHQRGFQPSIGDEEVTIQLGQGRAEIGDVSRGG
jgi:hypothetical protein